MIVYNVTVNVDDDVHEEWLKWMKEKHIPDVMATGIFTANNMFRLLVEEQQGTSYAIQYSCKTIEDYHRYRDEFAPRLQKEHTEKYGEKCVAFRTLLEQV
ncbi:MAG: hypothetical protein FD123_2021 [Bacteroidetes bacterium]|nr:MAG: hypothetical protein FD123_2021 [Bacteroidota bacterium]